ncbi:glutamate racemase [Mesonia sp. K7]|uniref:glutamate racemase n=1 Tax=Mesonia sp. K7 TaxID=2218606 RepID=UPI000DA9FBA0|nr:glutamate racemase [Mesonia sp. K7]PZD78741.1 glutamate racemase [Mesonia sp. K7]
MQKDNPIGMFDSGVGGTSILKEVYKLLPNEKIIYLADSKNAPYGSRSQQEIIDLSIKNTEFLLEKGAKIIVVACNTATTNAIKVLRANYTVPFIGIEPAIKPAALKSTNNIIGILATKGTLSSELFSETSKVFVQNTKIIEVVGEGLVPLIENGDLHSQKMISLLEKLLKPFIENQIDYLVLGCSHYPYIIPQIKRILPDNVSIIDSGEAVAKQTKAVLESKNLLSDHSLTEKPTLYTNKDIEVLELLLDNKNLQKYRISYLDF